MAALQVLTRVHRLPLGSRTVCTLSLNRRNDYSQKGLPQTRCLSTGQVMSGNDTVLLVEKVARDKILPSLSESDLLDFFSSYGKIKSVRWINGDRTKRSYEYGFVSFNSTISAEAVAKKQEVDMGGHLLKVYSASQRPPDAAEQGRSIVIFPLDGSSKGKLELTSVADYFSGFGELEFVKEEHRKVEKNSLVTFVAFKDPGIVKEVMSHGCHKIDGRIVRIELSLTRFEKWRRHLEKELSRDTELEMKEDQERPVEGRRVVVTTNFLNRHCITDKNLFEYFSAYGKIDHTFVLYNIAGGWPKCGFVSFKEQESVKDILKITDHKIGNTEVVVRRATPHVKTVKKLQGCEQSSKVYVTNVSKDTEEKDIFHHFSQFGTVRDVISPGSFDVSENMVTVVFSSLHGATKALENTKHMIASQDSELVVKSDTGHLVSTINTNKLLVSDVSKKMTLEMLRAYFEHFGKIQSTGFIPQGSSHAGYITDKVYVTFQDEFSVERAVNIMHHVIDGCKVHVVKMASTQLQECFLNYWSLKILISNLPSTADKELVWEYLKKKSCRVKSVRLYAEPSSLACQVQFWNLRDVDKLVKEALVEPHVIGQKPVVLRRAYWNCAQDGILNIVKTV